MLLTTILNLLPVQGFVYGQARWVQHLGQQAIEVAVRPRKAVAHSVLVAACAVLATIICRNGVLSSFRCGAFRSFWCMPGAGDCPDCGIVAEAIPWAGGKHHLTKAYMLLLARWARTLSWREVSRAFHTSWAGLSRG